MDEHESLSEQHIAQPDRILQRRRILQPRQRRLRTKIAARIGQPPAFCPLDISSIGFEFIDEGNGVDLHQPGHVAGVSPFTPAIEVANNRVHPKPVGAGIEMKNISPFPTHVARR